MEVELRVYTARFRTVDSWHIESLAAPYWRIYWNDRPGWEVRHGSRAVELGPDRLVVVAPETPCSGSSRNPAGHFHIHFLAGAPFDTVRCPVLERPLDREVRDLVRESVRLSSAEGPQSPRGVLLSQMLCLHALLLVPEDQTRREELDPRVAGALRTMQKQPGQPFSNPVLAREAGMHTNAFIRLFTSQVGESPQAWYMRRRVEEACRLLHHSTLSIKQIAERTGFCDRGHFSRVFRRERDIGPAEFRRQGAGAVPPADSAASRVTHA